MSSISAKPFEKGELYVSYSQLNTYLLCPEKFRQNYVKGTPLSFRPSAMVFGSAIHEALASFHSHLMTEKVKLPIDRLLSDFEDCFQSSQAGSVPVLWNDDDEEERLREQGRQLLQLYHEEGPNEVLAVEQPFTVPLLNSRGTPIEEQLVGVVDLIERDADGTVYITEIKTAGKKFDPGRLKFDRQVSLYASAREALGYPNAKLMFRVLVKTKTPTVHRHQVHRDEQQVKETTALVTQILRAIDHRIFYPLRGWVCWGCPYRSTCGE